MRLQAGAAAGCGPGRRRLPGGSDVVDGLTNRISLATSIGPSARLTTQVLAHALVEF